MKGDLMRKIILSLGICGGLLGRTTPAGADNGFVGSSQWFKDTRQVAQDQAIQRSLSRDTSGGAPQAVPAGYVSFSGQVVCPGGNPFPGGQFPDLRINDRNRQSDGVERAPHVAADGTFSTVFKRGDTYDFSWMYWMGGREMFATLIIASDCPSPCQAALNYRHGQAQFTPVTVGAAGGVPSGGTVPPSDPTSASANVGSSTSMQPPTGVTSGGVPDPNLLAPPPANPSGSGMVGNMIDPSTMSANSTGTAGQIKEYADAINEVAGATTHLTQSLKSASKTAGSQSANQNRGRIGVAVDGTGHITRLMAGAPAVTAGLQVGDQIIGIGKYSIETGRQLTQVLGKLTAGQKVRIRFIRAGQIQAVTTVAQSVTMPPGTPVPANPFAPQQAIATPTATTGATPPDLISQPPVTATPANEPVIEQPPKH